MIDTPLTPEDIDKWDLLFSHMRKRHACYIINDIIFDSVGDIDLYHQSVTRNPVYHSNYIQATVYDKFRYFTIDEEENTIRE